MLDGIDIGKEIKRTAQIPFAGEAAPELLHLARPRTNVCC